MIAGSSLQAFSNATTTSPLSRAQGSGNVRLVQAQTSSAPRQAAGTSPALPTTRPSVPPPRGSILNLSV